MQNHQYDDLKCSTENPFEGKVNPVIFLFTFSLIADWLQSPVATASGWTLIQG